MFTTLATDTASILVSFVNIESASQHFEYWSQPKKCERGILTSSTSRDVGAF